MGTDPASDDAGAGGGNDDGGAGNDGASGDDARISTLVDERVRSALEALGITSDASNLDPPPDGEPVTTPPPAAQSAASNEARVEEIVRRALEKQGKEKERDERLTKVEKAIEKPPIKQSWLSRKMWGDFS